MPPAGDHSITGQRGKIKEETMFREMIDEAIYLFGDMTPKQILKEVLQAAGCFILMVGLIILLFGIQPI